MTTERTSGSDRAEERIDLVRAELSELTRTVADVDRPEPFGVYAFDTLHPGAALARIVEREVFWEAFGNAPDLLEREYGPYEAASVFFCVVDHRRQIPVGMMRCVTPNPAGLKSLNDMASAWDDDPGLAQARTGISLPEQSTWDIATLAVRHDYRGTAARGLVSLALFRALSMAHLQFGFTHMVTIMDTKVLRLLQLQLRQLFHPFVGVVARSYLDSPLSLPVWSDIHAWIAVQLASDSAIYDVLFRGGGLVGAVATPDWQPLEAALGRGV